MHAELERRLREACRLKHVTRAGWVRVGVDAPESVAAHSWGVSFLVLALCPAGVDRERALAMAVVHDLAEVRTGDLTPHDGVDKADKHARERAALEDLVAPLERRDELVALFCEYDEGASREARFVKACDKLDMALTAKLYREAGHDTGELIASALAALEPGTLRALAG